MNDKKAVIAMSGGIDSSVSALIMLRKGFDCTGVTMKLFSNDDVGIPREHSCCSLDDIADARAVAYKLGMPYYVLNFAEKFDEKVIRPFVHSYEIGETPNPCIECNRYLKFRKLFERADELDARYIVTGHYSQILWDEDRKCYMLKKGEDSAKDQSYVLYFLTQEQLSRILLPMGDMKKPEARKLAEEAGLINAQKPDSQDICFVQKGRYPDFIENYTKHKYPHGDFLLTDGTKIGEHKGIISYTIGQRKHLGVSYSEPLYVVRKDMLHNAVILGTEKELYSSEVYVRNCNFITDEQFDKPVHIKAKLRYRMKEQPCTAEKISDGRVKLTFDEPQRAVTAGQAAVFYLDDYVLGGGTIC